MHEPEHGWPRMADDKDKRIAELEAERDSEARWAKHYLEQAQKAEAACEAMRAVLDAIREQHGTLSLKVLGKFKGNTCNTVLEFPLHMVISKALSTPVLAPHPERREQTAAQRFAAAMSGKPGDEAAAEIQRRERERRVIEAARMRFDANGPVEQAKADLVLLNALDALDAPTREQG